MILNLILNWSEKLTISDHSQWILLSIFTNFFISLITGKIFSHIMTSVYLLKLVFWLVCFFFQLVSFFGPVILWMFVAFPCLSMPHTSISGLPAWNMKSMTFPGFPWPVQTLIFNNYWMSLSRIWGILQVRRVLSTEAEGRGG